MSRRYECGYCGQRFKDANEFEQHKITHLPATVRCLACHRKLTTYPGMVIHLEASTCEGGVDLPELNKLAARCFQWKKYINTSFRQELLEGKIAYRYKHEDPFQCPTCEEDFPLLSSMFMHGTCGQGRKSGAIAKLRRWSSKSLYGGRP